MIVASEGRMLEELARNPKFSLLQDLGHELAHFWWNFGAGQGDWINETFAECSSAFAVEQIVSEEQFQKVLEAYRTAVRELPADAQTLGQVLFDGSGFVVRYYKGSLMMDVIRQAMGNDAFAAASREFFKTYTGKSIGTEEFRSFWKRKLPDKKDLVDLWLDSTGGVPQGRAEIGDQGVRRVPGSPLNSNAAEWHETLLRRGKVLNDAISGRNGVYFASLLVLGTHSVFTERVGRTATNRPQRSIK